MWPFPAKPAPRADLEARVEKIERGLRDIRLDWDSQYEKFSMLHKRLSKRDQRAAEETPPKNPVRDLVTRLGGI